MIKRFKGSRIEIWGTRYINNSENRREEDKKAIIYQIESVGDSENFIVEVGYNADPTKGVY